MGDLERYHAIKLRLQLYGESRKIKRVASGEDLLGGIELDESSRLTGGAQVEEAAVSLERSTQKALPQPNIFKHRYPIITPKREVARSGLRAVPFL